MTSYLSVAPEILAATAQDLTGIGSAISAADAAAAALTTRMAPAAADEVSAAIASLFSGHGRAFQALSELSRELDDDLEGPVVQADALDQARSVSGQDRRTPDVLAEGFAFPLKICLGAIDRFIRESEGIARQWQRRRRRWPRRRRRARS